MSKNFVSSSGEHLAAINTQTTTTTMSVFVCVCVCRHAHKYYAFITFNDSTKMLINYNSMMISAKTRGKSN